MGLYMMTKKDFQKLARVVSSFEDEPTRAQVANVLALILSRVYKDFNAARFIEEANKRG